ncbi:MAG: acetate/propionate family kinase [Deltaproteobacteria bacterium]|nr:acetate/propionate family kinase [Deltaproteobacteria bacterium]
MRIAVINCGSSSIKACILESADGRRLASASVERVGELATVLSVGQQSIALDGADHRAALQRLLPLLIEAAGGQAVAAVGHRVVHGGEQFDRPVRIDDTVEQAIEAAAALAPLHNPPNLAGIRAAREVLPDVAHVAVFDTAFFATLPRRASRYAIPQVLAEKYQIKRFGFHGTSHRYVAQRAASALGSDIRDLRIISCHLGNGCSVAAIEGGRAIETSMGMTPLEGLVMGSRSGDIDAGILLALMRDGYDAEALDALLNRQSGLLGLSGKRDMRDIEAAAADGDDGARLALAVFAHRVRKYVGAYAAVLGGVDALVFTGGIGQNSALIRHRVCQRMEFLGARLCEERNRQARADHQHPDLIISQDHSRCQIIVVATDEELAIARDAAQLCAAAAMADAEQLAIPLAVSARHVHLSERDLGMLFGEGYTLTPERPLSQPGQFAAQERVSLVGPRGRIDGVRVLGPTRSQTQVEISRTDEFRLGVDAPVRASGDVDNSPGLTLVGPAGELALSCGVICAWRHIHITPKDAKRFGVRDRDLVSVAVDSAGRDLIFGDVLVRVSERFSLEMHIDTDEANAAEIDGESQACLWSAGRDVRLVRRTVAGDRPKG